MKRKFSVFFLFCISWLFFLALPRLGFSLDIQSSEYAMLKGAEVASAVGVPSCNAHQVIQETPRLQISLLSQCKHFHAGSPLYLKLEFVLAEGWNLYYGPNPGDLALPSELHWDLPKGFSVDPLAWPVPERKIDDIGQLSYTYPGNFALYPVIRTSPESSAFELKLNYKLQLCSGHCAVEEGSITLDFSIANETEHECKSRSDQAFRCQRVSEVLYRSPAFKLPDNIEMNAGLAYELGKQRDNFLVTSFEMKGEQHFDKAELASSLLILDQIPAVKTEFLEWKLDRDNKRLRAISRLSCDSKCDPTKMSAFNGLLDLGKNLGAWRIELEKTSLKIDDKDRKSSEDDIFIGIDWNAYQVKVPDPQNASQNSSILVMLLLAFIGGLLLNVMPCVLPVLSLKALSIVEDGASGRQRQSAIFYTLGVLFSFWTLGLALLLVKGAGQMAGWGFQFQSPGYILGMAAVIYLLSLSLLGIFEIPGLTISGKQKSRNGKRASFMQGILMTALSTPCSAPFLGTALVFALTRGSVEIMLILTFVAAGLVMPIVMLAIFPSTRRWIPKPGAWMVSFKQIIGFLLLGTVVYLYAILLAQISVNGMTRALALLLVLAFVAWILGKWTGPMASKREKIIALVSVISLSFVAFAVQDLRPQEQCSADKEDALIAWEGFDEEKFAQDISQKRSIILDFTAAWCPTCKVNEATALNTQAVADLIKEKSIVSYRIDMTTRNDLGQKWIAHFGRAAIPLLVVIADGDLDNPVVLPEIFTQNQLVEVLESL